MIEFAHYCKNTHSEWHPILIKALNAMDQEYLNNLLCSKDWLPGLDRLFAAFSLPLSATSYILFGESPYPRKQSANGYAFWDNAVESLWSEQGLSKPVNRATSLRNIIKMLLRARGDLTADTSQYAISQIDKASMVQTAEQFFTGMMQKGVLLLNATLVFEQGRVPYHARHWRPFMHIIVQQLTVIKPTIQLILLGKIAEIIPVNKLSIGLLAEHPYNLSFITNPKVIDFFKPLDLLSHDSD